VQAARKGKKMKRPKHHDQQGQTFLWFIAMLASCCALLMIVYNVGQVATEKEKTTNAADAVAMSGALVQARGMNLLAYNNRAIIANEMTIAQIAALDSWVKYNDQIAVNLQIVSSWIPVVNSFTTTLANVMNQIQSVVNEVAQIGVPGFQYAVDALEIQRVAIFTAIPLAANDMASQVAAQNNVEMNDNMAFTVAAAAKNAYDFWIPIETGNNNYFVLHQKNGANGNDDRQAANDVIMNSRDQFTANRGPGLAIDAFNSTLSLVPVVRPELIKTSGSTKLRDFDHWESQDSMDLFTSVCVPLLGCAGVPTGVVGWGRANVNNDDSRGKNWANNWECNGLGWTPACFAAYYNNDQLSGWNGVPDMLDVKDRNQNMDPTKEINYYVSVKKAAADKTLTSQQLGIANADVPGPQGSPRVTDNLATVNGTAELQAISAARVFFKRPKRASADKTEGGLARQDNVQEFASLYNPYWQARLHTPNCKLSSLSSQDCLWRELLDVGMGQPLLEAAIDAVSP